MNREEALRRIQSIPEFIPAPCPWCGARTLEEAGTKCRPQSLPCGEYYCGTPEDAPDHGGLIHQINPDYADLDGYLWSWLAFDEGLTDTPPTWEDEDDAPTAQAGGA